MTEFPRTARPEHPPEEGFEAAPGGDPGPPEWAHEPPDWAQGPPGGWTEEPPEWAREYFGPPPPRGRAPDLSPLLVLLEGIRRLVPTELEEQFTTLLREVLKTIRALIDWYLERLDSARKAPEVEDIPID
jgi:hypothetical protein